MIRKYGGQRRGDRQGTHFFMIFVSNLFSYFLTLPHTLNRPSIGNLFRLVLFVSEFLGRLQPSKTTIQKTRGTLRVEESSYPRKVLHFYNSNKKNNWRTTARGSTRHTCFHVVFGTCFVLSHIFSHLE